MRRIVLVLFLVSVNISLTFGAYGGHDLFTSLGQLNELWKNERTVVQDMENAITHMDEIKESFKRYIASHKDTELDQEPNFDYLGQPLNGYFMIRHVALGWAEIREKVFVAENKTREIFDRLKDRENVKLPDAQDIKGAAFGLARLHSQYNLNTTEMIENGIIESKIKNGIQARSEPSIAKLSAFDLEAIASQGQAQGLYNTMVDFYGVVIDKFKAEQEQDKPPFESFMFNTSANIKDLQRSVNNAVELHDQILIRRGSRSGIRTHEKPVDPKLRKKKKFKKKLSSYYEIKDPIYLDEEEAKGTRKKDDPDLKHKSDLQKELLCTGVTFRKPEDDKDLRCFYGSNGSPWLRLAPLKVEVRNHEPYVAVLKELMFHHECDNITRFLGPHLDFPPGRMNPRNNVNDWTMKNVWPVEKDNLYLAKMTRRVEQIANLLGSSEKNEADNFMCGNYGIGGHYGTHPDFNAYTESLFYDPNSRANRIATVMTILEAPSSGGATVWPFLGVAVFPEKGSAVMWYNTKNDGVPDHLTLHAACPVLLGQKWIGNKWIGYKPQWRTQPCGLEQFERIRGQTRG